MAKRYLLSESYKQSLDRLIEDGKHHAGVRRSESPPPVGTRLPALLVNAGPAGEADHSDNRYWFKSAEISNAEDPVDETARVEMTAEENDPAESPGNHERLIWETASNLGESSPQSHELPVDGTQQVIVERVYDARSPGGARWVFSVMLIAIPFTVGGQFLAAGTRPATNFICDSEDGTRWNHAFNSFPRDTGNVMYDHAVFDDELYGCGLLNLGGAGVQRLFKWDTDKWVAVTGHDFDQIYTMLVFGGSLHLGGTRTGGVNENVRTYDGSSFADATGGPCLGQAVHYLYDWNGALVACGVSSLGDGFHGIATLGGGSWSPLGTGLFLTGGVNPGSSFGCCDYDGDLAIVGRFSEADGTAAENVVLWNGSAMSNIGDIGDASTTMYTACIWQDQLYVGGTASFLYRHDGSTDFEEVGEQLVAFLEIGSVSIRSLCVAPDDSCLIVAGLFQKRVSEEFGGYMPALCVVKYGDIDPAEWAATNSYRKGAIVQPTAAAAVIHQCTTPGVSGSSEPTWATTVGGTTNDGSVVWTAIEKNQYRDYHGGIGDNYGSTPAESGLAGVVMRVRSLQLPGADAAVACFSGTFIRASRIYSSLLARLTASAWKSCALGLRVSGFTLPTWQPNHDYNKSDRVIPSTPNGYSYQPKNDGLPQSFAGTSGATEPSPWSTTLGGETADGSIIWITRDESYPSSPAGSEGFVWGCVRYASGVVVFGSFAGFVNGPGRGTLPYGVAINVVFYKSDAFTQMGRRDGAQLGGCLFNGRPVLCGEYSAATVATWFDAPAWEENTAYVVGDVVVPTTPNGFQYRCITAGTSDANPANEPDWPTNPGHAVGDGAGALEWECEDLAWVGIGTNIEPGGEHWSVADFDGKLWLFGTAINISSATYDFATSTGAVGAAGNWTGGNITGAIGVLRSHVANLDGMGDKLYVACQSLAGVDGCCYVCSPGSTTFAEVGGVGNRVSGLAYSITSWVDSDGVKCIVICGDLDLNGTPCSMVEYRSGTWTEIAGVLDLGGQAYALGTWIRERNAVLMGGDYGFIESLVTAHLSVFDGTEWDMLRDNLGGTSAPVITIGLKTNAG